MQVISTPKAPQAIGPYSQAIVANGLVFCSGQIPLDPETMTVINGTVSEQTRQVLKNLASILENAGSSLDRVVKTTVYLKDLSDFDHVNAVYAEYFPQHKPARVCIQAAKLPRDAAVEIDAIAVVES